MQFSHKLITQNGKSIEFTFSDSYTVYGGRYLVKVFDGKDQLYSFKMKKTSEQWIIIGTSSIPEWIWKLESALSAIIINHKN